MHQARGRGWPAPKGVGSGADGGRLGARAATAESTAVCGRLAHVGVSKRDRGGKEKGARAVLKPKYIHWLTDEYTWALPRIFISYR
jgi:hypothetical protein